MPLAPIATTGAATSVGPTSATLNGTSNPQGSDTTVDFEYGVSTSYGATTTPQDIGVGALLPTAYATNGLGTGWNLIFRDDFQGPTLDLTKWGYGWYAANPLSPSSYSWFGNYVSASATLLNDNTLTTVGTYPGTIGGASTAGSYTGKGLMINYATPGTPYSFSGHTFNSATGFISTAPSEGQISGSPLFSFTYGYVEARIWAPGASGLTYNWPSFWMTGLLGTNGSYPGVYNGMLWPLSAELDVMEGLAGHPAGHWHGSTSFSGNTTSGSNQITGCTSIQTGGFPALPGGFTAAIGDVLYAPTIFTPVVTSGAIVGPTITAIAGTTITASTNSIHTATQTLIANVNKDDSGGAYTSSTDMTNGWHTYGAWWNANGTITWYYDGVAHVKSFFGGATDYQVPIPMFLILGGGPSNGGNTAVYTSAGMILVDYVRVWQPGTAPTTDLPVTAPVTGLSPATTYHFRLDATSLAGSTPGTDATFTTASSTGVATGGSAWPGLAVEIDFANDPTSGTRTWVDVTTDVRALSYTRAGRSDPLQQTATGTLSMLLDNLTGNYDPLNTAGSHYPNVKRMRWIRVRAVWAGVTYDRWRGLITSWAPDWPQSGKDATVAVTAADALKVLSLYDLAGLDLAAQRTDQRVATVCTVVGLPYTATTGQSTVVDTGTLTPSSYALSHLQQVEDTENGRLFADPGGTIVFQDRTYRQTHSLAPSGTIGDRVGELRYDQSPLTLDDSNLWNQVMVTPSGGTAETASDASSQASYYSRALSKDLLTASQIEANSAASYLVRLYRNPAPKLPVLTLRPLRDPTVWPTVLAAKNSDQLQFRRRPIYGGTITVNGYVEQIAETIVPGQSWDVAIQLSAVGDQATWVLGNTTLGLLGSTTIVGY